METQFFQRVTDQMGISYPYLTDPSLALSLPLHELDGSLFRSKDSRGHLCTVTGALWTPQGRAFDGDDLINIDSALTQLASTTAGTWEIWAKLTDATPESAGALISFGDTDAIEYILLQVRATSEPGNIQVICNKDGIIQWAFYLASPFTDNVFAHVVLVQDGTAPALYFNGEPASIVFTNETDKTAWFSVLTGLDNGRIGCGNAADNGNYLFHVGTEGEVRLYNRALSAAEIQNNYLVTKWRYV